MSRKVLYNGKPYFVIEDNGSGLIRIAETQTTNSFGQVTGYTGDIRHVEKDDISAVPARGNIYTTLRENIAKARMKSVDELCEFCSDPIYADGGRRRIGKKSYHLDKLSDCFLESVKLKAESERVIEKCAESMLFDKRITA